MFQFGVQVTRNYAAEEVTLNTSGTTTATTTNLAPANSRILSIEYRVTQAIVGATDYSVKITGGGNWYSIGTTTAAQTGLVLGTSGILVPSVYQDQFVSTANTLTITTTGTPSGGKIRLVVVYEQFTAPSS